jgi:hypothetical protein
MLTLQRETAFVTRIAAIAVLSVGFAATGTLSAFADYGPASHSTNPGT